MANKKNIVDSEVEIAAKEFGTAVGQEATRAIYAAYCKLTDDEKQKFVIDGPSGLQYMRMARTMFLAIGEAITAQFEVEAVRVDVKKIKRILKNRY